MSTLIQYEPFVDSTTELFLEQTEKLFVETDQSCNFSRWLQFYAFDVIGEMTYSKRHGFLEENKDIEGIIDYISTLFNYVAPVCIALIQYWYFVIVANIISLSGWSDPCIRSSSTEKSRLPPRFEMGSH
jgi:hypothetical protein